MLLRTGSEVNRAARENTSEQKPGLARPSEHPGAGLRGCPTGEAGFKPLLSSDVCVVCSRRRKA